MAITGGFDPNAFQNSQFQTPGTPPPPPIPPPPLTASDDSVSGATRSGIARSDSWPIEQWLMFRINGDTVLDPYADPVVKGSIQIQDNQNETQDTASFLKYGTPLNPGQEIVIAAGTYAIRLFGGAVQRVTQLPMKPGQPEVWQHDCVDWWYFANRKQVYAKYLTFPADEILKDVFARFTTGFTFDNVKAAPNITGGIEFSGSTPQSAAQQICNRIGWECYIDAHRDVHFYDLEDVHARALEPGRYHYWDLRYSEDSAQIRNRVYQECGGGTSTAQVLAGATSIPVDVVTWYPTTGPNKRVVVGGQIIPYTAIAGSALTIPAGAITHVIPQGTEISLLVQVDDLESQARVAAAEGPDSDGVHEFTASPDHRLSEDGGITKATAELLAFADNSRSGSYSAYDDDARSGRMVEIRLPYRGAPMRDKRFMITSVTTRVLGPKRQFEKSISFGTTEKLDFYTALRGVI
jgi:hypothetical protein